ncbi:MAG: phenylalanine--tRNA ligase subunit beta [Actinobacteria bacterium]|uniref:Phenylalanine--tRNA ligase beta subunit n=1 Tax=freshwater metagenome TaxID=449393 RepID=A0A6J7DPT7_9ZZZZ|nr:phenylalanine--tRNA ligase subunit beta [Actinomycetota bacterium]
MRAPVSWLRTMVDIPSDQGGRDIAEHLVGAGLEVETVELIGEGVVGEIVLGLVVEIEELTEFKKPIRWCQVDVGPEHGGVRGVICGARNFSVGDRVVVALPGTVLPGGFEIAARETYGHTSNGMICSERELGLGDNHDGIMVLPAESGEIGADAATIVGVGDEVLDIAVTPDRGYALSMRGIARELATAYGVAFDDPGTVFVELPAPAADAVPAECASLDFSACGLFTLRTIVGFDPKAPSPQWMQRRLVACGMRPVSLAVDVTNYVMLELGQPLHAFDLDKLQGAVRADWATPGAEFETLDHVVRTLQADDLVIRDDRGIIGLAGVMGGLESEIDDSTVSIALEAAHFTAGVIARSSRRHRLSSEASRRFERGVDRVLAPYASARAAALLIEFGGGRYVGMTAVEGAMDPTVIAMHSSEPSSVAGMPIDGETVVRMLESVGCLVADEAGRLSVTVPAWRADLTDPADLIEEVVRLVGYDELPSTLPTSALGHGLTKAQRMRRRIGMALAARGGVEVLTYPFVGDHEIDALRVAEGDPRRSRVRLANPISDEQPLLRASLLPGLVAAARRNIGRGTSDLSLFEVGAVVRGVVGSPVARPSIERRPSDAEWASLNAMLPEQPSLVAMVLTGDRVKQGWWGEARPQDWSDAIEWAQVVAHVIGLRLTVERGDDPTFHPGRCAVLLVGDRAVGVAGELHPRVIEGTSLPERSCAMELHLDELLALAPEVRPAPSVGTQPVAKEDIALVVPDGVPAQAVEQALRAGAGALLESVRLFDVYRGAQVESGHRSLAFALRFRAPDRTLDATEIQSARHAALQAAEAACGARLR